VVFFSGKLLHIERKKHDRSLAEKTWKITNHKENKDSNFMLLGKNIKVRGERK